MEVTVVIPNYNGIRYMEACLDSLYRGSMIPEVIVIDNASHDGSAELVEEKYPQCRLIRFSENTGFCVAVNEGIRQAGSEYVILYIPVDDIDIIYHLPESRTEFST